MSSYGLVLMLIAMLRDMQKGQIPDLQKNKDLEKAYLGRCFTHFFHIYGGEQQHLFTDQTMINSVCDYGRFESDSVRQ